MNLYFRLLGTWVSSWFAKPMSCRNSCSQWFRVWPHDLDAFGHMNNGRYLQIMDVARMRWLLRTGTVREIRRNRWRVALGGNLTRFRHPLSLFSRYRVVSRLLCWDERWFYLEHVFVDGRDRVLAVGMSRAAFRGDGRWVQTKEVIDCVDPGVTSIPIPAYVTDWMAAEEALFGFCAGDDPRPDRAGVDSARRDAVQARAALAPEAAES